MKKKKTHAEIPLTVDGVELKCQVPYRYLNQVANSDDIHTDRDYVRIALENLEAITVAARTRLASHVQGKPLLLERADFPPKV